MKALRSGVLALFLLMCMANTTWARGVSRMEIFPNNVKMRAGHSLQFTVVAYTRDGYAFTPNQNVVWRTDRGQVYNGQFTAPPNQGRYTLWAEWRGIRAKAYVQVEAATPRIKYIQITPAEIKLRPGERYQFRAIAYDHRRRPVSVPLKWRANGGRITQGMYYAPNNYGQYVVTAFEPYSNVQAQATVWIRQPGPQISRLEVFPPKSFVRPGQSVRFFAKAYDQHGREIPVNANWRASGGRIDAQGMFYAGHQPGKYQVWAEYGGYQGSSWVTIGGGHHPDPPHHSGRIDVLDFKPREGNFFEPKVKATCRVFGKRVQKATLFLVLKNGRAKELQTRYCTNGQEVKFRERYNALAGYHWADIYLYDNRGNVIAKERRSMR